MPESTSQADIAYQYEMWIGRTADDATTWQQILGIETLPFPDQAPEDIDVTHFQSPGRTRETRPGLLAVVDTALEKQMWPAHAGDLLLIELEGLTRAGEKEDVLIEFNTGGATPAVRRTYRGYISTYVPSDTVGEKAMVAVGMKIFDRQASNPREGT
ncbi:phage tail tube protein [Salipiger marinus]|uniref:Uncharacterized protein n=1 Tax=Salipiger marinus TaxID=555512 RepID=A0A1G8RX72_9RHOB|nr:phage tail tube protein [Salipiger marinus]SDJ21512.1 hypothetical protein SAMN04487993_102218 [Salipiger marinus]